MGKIFTPHPKQLLNDIRDKFINESKESCLCVTTLNFVYGKVILLALFTFSSIACGTTTTIEMPTIEQLSTTNDTTLTRSAILAGIKSLGWKVEGESEGQIDAVRQEQDRLAAIRITYDENSIEFHYLRSENFGCEPAGSSCAKIHQIYGQWVVRLRSWIKHELDLATIPPELKQEAVEIPDARIGTLEPVSGFEQIGPIASEDGHGCGLFGRRGSYEMAVALLKAKARSLRATYVQIIGTTEPHQSSTYCFDNRYQIRGFAFRDANSGHGNQKKRGK